MTVQLLENDVVWRELDGEIVILNLATGHYYGLEGAANEMWRLLLEHKSTDRVVALMQRTHAVDRKRLSRDLDTLVRELARKKVLKIDSGKRR